MSEKEQYAFFIDDKGLKNKIPASEILIQLANGQTLTVTYGFPERGVVISDHTNLDPKVPVKEQPKEYAVLDIQPMACNVISVNSKNYKLGSKK